MKNEKHIRQIALPQIGEAGQQKLSEASVLVVGAGGLGHAVLPYLASSGIGRIGIIDGDTVSKSNLHRQVLFSEADIGKSKVNILQKKLCKQYPEVVIKAHDNFLNSENALRLFKTYTIIVDATDNIAIRYLINDACVLTNKPFVHASVYRFQFQVATFNVNNSGTYRCLYPNAPKSVQSCEEAGVMPTTVALAGLFQANEVFKYILKIGDLLINTVLLMDTLTNKQHQFSFQKKKHDFITSDFFEMKHRVRKTFNFEEAKQKNAVFLDVRQKEELPNLKFDNYIQIPLQNLRSQLDQLSKAKRIFIFCQSGKRSASALKILEEHNFQNSYCLEENAPEIFILTVGGMRNSTAIS